MMIKKDLFDTNASLYVLSCLMRNPLLLQNDQYAFVKTDFYKPLQEMVFYAIYNMAQEGVQRITPQDIDLYLKQYSAQYEFYQQNKGYEFVLQCYQTAEGSDEKQFNYYYNRLKKFSVLRDLESLGVDTKQFYDTEKDALNRDLEDEKLNKLSVEQILNSIRNDIVSIENRHVGKDDSNSQLASQGMRDLVKELQANPEVGLPIDGDIINWASRGARLGKLYMYSAPSGGGKALPNNTLIPLADGSWKTVGEVKIGDLLIDRHGKATRVSKIFPQGLKDVYQITFKDGRTALCNNEHLWTYHNFCSRDYNKLETKTLQELINIINQKGIRTYDQYRFGIPVNDAVEYPTQDLSLDPYVLGLLIGDGSFREHPSNRNLSFSDGEEILVKSLAKIMNYEYHRFSEYNFSYSFKDLNNKNVHVKEFCEKYDIMELYNKYSQEKVIPLKYLKSNIEQRWSLLQGLMDTDGDIDTSGRVTFTNTSYELIKQVQQLCWSLGLFASIYEDKRSKKYTDSCYSIHIICRPEYKLKIFRMERKMQRVYDWLNNGKRKEYNIYNPIINIEKLDYQEEMTCFLVDNEEHLFLMNDFIVTHNTRYMVGNACAISMPYIDTDGKVIMRSDYEKVLFVATEMQADEIQTLILAYVSGVNEKTILLGNYSTDELERVRQALDIIDRYGKNFIIECIPDPSIAMIKARLVKYIVQDEIYYIFYDYIFSSPGLLSEFRDIAVREDRR